MPFHFVSDDFEWWLFYDDNITVSVESSILDKRHSGCFWLNLFLVYLELFHQVAFKDHMAAITACVTTDR